MILDSLCYAGILLYMFGILLGCIAFVNHLNDGELKEFISAFGIEKRLSNGAGILLSLMLISVWPIFAIRPVVKWLMEPME